MQLIFRLVLGSVFIYASIEKIANPQGFVNIIKNYGILPDNLSFYTGIILPWIELIFGVLLIVGLSIFLSASVLSSLLIIFIAAIIYGSISGNIEDCGCFSLSHSTNPNILIFIIRDILLLSFGLFIIKYQKLKMKSIGTVNETKI